jgi:hypothetical protein
MPPASGEIGKCPSKTEWFDTVLQHANFLLPWFTFPRQQCWCWLSQWRSYARKKAACWCGSAPAELGSTCHMNTSKQQPSGPRRWIHMAIPTDQVMWKYRVMYLRYMGCFGAFQQSRFEPNREFLLHLQKKQNTWALVLSHGSHVSEYIVARDCMAK